MKTYIIDRIEGDIAVLEGEGGAMRDLPAAKLPAGARQGDVLCEAGGAFTIDKAATAARAENIRRKMRGLFGD